LLLSTEKVLLLEDSLAPGALLGGGPARVRSARHCPRCESHSVARSRIRGLLGETAKRLLGIRPYRCLDCWHRFLATSKRA
jgi:predicted Zn-ribbon and HTH transcriptional regulator